MEKAKLKVVMYACIILHNMILEDEGHATCQDYDPTDPSLDPEYWTQDTTYETRRLNNAIIRNKEMHIRLKNDLVKHVWENKQQYEDRRGPLRNYLSSDDEAGPSTR